MEHEYSGDCNAGEDDGCQCDEHKDADAEAALLILRNKNQPDATFFLNLFQ